MKKWIEINLPWRVVFKTPTENKPKEPDLEQKAIKKLGKKVYQGFLDYEKTYKEWFESSSFDGVKEFEAKMDKLEKYNKAYKKWWGKQPEVKAWEKEWDKIQDAAQEENNKKSFCGRGLAKPGTVIETDKGERMVIGDITSSGGTCDHCGVSDDMIIKRYYELELPK